MIKPICDFCTKELTEFGGILFDPPRQDGFARKRHVCVKCMERFDALAPRGDRTTDEPPEQAPLCSLCDAVERPNGFVAHSVRCPNLPRSAAMYLPEQAPEPAEGGSRLAAIELLNHLAYDHANAPENLEESIRAIFDHDARRYAAGVEAGRGELEAREHWVTRGVCPECHGCGDIRPEVGCPHCDATGCTELGRTVARLEEELEDMRSDAAEQAPEPTGGDRARATALLDALAYDHANHPDNLEESIRTIHEHDATARAQGEAAGAEGRKGAK